MKKKIILRSDPRVRRAMGGAKADTEKEKGGRGGREK